MPLILDVNEIEDGILNEVYKWLAPLFLSAAQKAKERVKFLVRTEILTSSTVLQLYPGGDLYHQIGNPNIEEDINTVVDLIISHIDLDVSLIPLTLHTDGIHGEFVLNILRADFQDILNLPQASFSYSNKEGQLTNLPWLAWLLGTNTVLGYHYVGKTSKSSRTNFGFMAPGGNWNVPTIYSGNSQDNFLTRTMKKIEDEVVNTIEQEFNRQLNA